MNTENAFQDHWEYILKLFPSHINLEATAKEFGALNRKREIKSASDLLRLILAYSILGLSFRVVSSWATISQISNLSDVAFLKRMRKSANWLKYLLSELIKNRVETFTFNNNLPPIYLIDATTLSVPRSKGVDWRVHTIFNLQTLMIRDVEVTDVKGGETLKRISNAEGAIIVGDRGYAHRSGIDHLVKQGAKYIIRGNWQNIPLLDKEGTPFNIFKAFKSLPKSDAMDFEVTIAEDKKNKIPANKARLVAIRKSKVASEIGKEKAKKAAKKKRRNVHPNTLESMDYFFVLTNISADEISNRDILEIYRFRWQIELAFKRMKSIVGLDNLTSRDPDIAKSIIFAKLIGILLMEDLARRSLAFSPWGYY